MNIRNHNAIIVIFSAVVLRSIAVAGPPFLTDDPQPVDYQHWEFYLASQQQYHGHDVNATLPHIEINYGAVQNVQLHVVFPMSFVHEQGESHYSYSNTEVGIKFRFIQESDYIPQIGTFPMIEIPTAINTISPNQNLTQVYLPIWFQKSWGDCTTYFGGGYWNNPGSNNKNWIFTGWEVQYDFSKSMTLGGEIYFHTADTEDGKPTSGFNLGGYLNVTENHHILFSFGGNITGENILNGYIGYQFTI